MFLSWFFLFFFQNLWFNIPMMNDMMPTIEETATAADLAQIEHEEWLRECEREERWEAIEATHGPLLTAAEWKQHTIDMDEIIAEADAAWADFENAFKCDEDDDEDAWADDDHDSMNDGHGTLADDAWHDAHEFPEW